MAGKSQPSKAGWEERRTGDGRVYFMNIKTGECSWNRPESEKPATPPAGTRDTSASPSSASNAPPAAVPPAPPAPAQELFSNDGSFMAKFLALQRQGATPVAPREAARVEGPSASSSSSLDKPKKNVDAVAPPASSLASSSRPDRSSSPNSGQKRPIQSRKREGDASPTELSVKKGSNGERETAVSAAAEEVDSQPKHNDLLQQRLAAALQKKKEKEAAKKKKEEQEAKRKKELSSSAQRKYLEMVQNLKAVDKDTDSTGGKWLVR